MSYPVVLAYKTGGYRELFQHLTEKTLANPVQRRIVCLREDSDQGRFDHSALFDNET
jgi:hypothetical protein